MTERVKLINKKVVKKETSPKVVKNRDPKITRMFDAALKVYKVKREKKEVEIPNKIYDIIKKYVKDKDESIVINEDLLKKKIKEKYPNINDVSAEEVLNYIDKLYKSNKEIFEDIYKDVPNRFMDEKAFVKLIKNKPIKEILDKYDLDDLREIYLQKLERMHLWLKEGEGADRNQRRIVEITEKLKSLPSELKNMPTDIIVQYLSDTLTKRQEVNHEDMIADPENYEQYDNEY